MMQMPTIQQPFVGPITADAFAGATAGAIINEQKKSDEKTSKG